MGTEYGVLAHEIATSPDSIILPILNMMKTALGKFSSIITFINFLVPNHLDLCAVDPKSSFVNIFLFFIRTSTRILEIRKFQHFNELALYSKSIHFNEFISFLKDDCVNFLENSLAHFLGMNIYIEGAYDRSD